MIEEGELRVNLIQKGLVNVKRFDAERIAGEYLEMYQWV